MSFTGLSVSLLFSLISLQALTPSIELGDFHLNNIYRPKGYEYIDDKSETIVNFQSYIAPYTEESHLVMIWAQASFYPRVNYRMMQASIALQAYQYTYSFSGSLTYHGGNVYYINGYPHQSNVTATYGSSTSSSITFGNQTKEEANFNFESFDLAFKNQNSFSIQISSTNSKSFTGPNPQLFTRLIKSSTGYNQGFEWTLSYIEPTQHGYIQDVCYVFEIDDDKMGTFNDNQFTLYVETQIVTIDNTNNVHTDSHYKEYKEFRMDY